VARRLGNIKATGAQFNGRLGSIHKNVRGGSYPDKAPPQDNATCATSNPHTLFPCKHCISAVVTDGLRGHVLPCCSASPIPMPLCVVVPL
jgi:hypothetical protein